MRKKMIEGIIRLHTRGFGFVKPTNKKISKSIFIPYLRTSGACSGDFVEVEITGESEKGPEGVVTRILKRNRDTLTGTIVGTLSRGEMLLHVPQLGSHSPIRLLTTGKRKLKIGDRITAKVEKWPEKEEMTVASFLFFIGPISDASSDLEATKQAFELPSSFSKEAEEEAKSYGSHIQASDLKGRIDLREKECFTIDPETARDYDDALSLERDKKGNFHLIVHIADVSAYVKADSALDKEAKARGNSFYFPRSVVPMLPESLSNELCSLKADVDRLTISVFMTFDKLGELKNYKIAKSVIQSSSRLTYHLAKEILEGKRKSKHFATLKLMQELCEKLIHQRSKRGSLQLNVPSLIVKVDEKGMPFALEIEEYDVTHQLVEEFMLKANEIVATHLAKENKPLTYRVHDAPSAENMKDFIFFAKMLGFSLPQKPTSEDLQKFFDEVRFSRFGPQITTAFIRSMKLASYSIDNIGHFGLGLDYYTHFTSPIRRYIDLVIHRLLFEPVDPNEDYSELALHCSEREQLAAKAEGELVLLKKLRYLDKSLKEDPDHLFEAIITQVKPQGIVFNVSELLIEGFLPRQKLDDDFYYFDERRKLLVARESKTTFSIGEKIWVIPDEIDLIFLEARWAFVEKERENQRKKKR